MLRHHGLILFKIKKCAEWFYFFIILIFCLLKGCSGSYELKEIKICHRLSTLQKMISIISNSKINSVVLKNVSEATSKDKSEGISDCFNIKTKGKKKHHSICNRIFVETDKSFPKWKLPSNIKNLSKMKNPLIKPIPTKKMNGNAGYCLFCQNSLFTKVSIVSNPSTLTSREKK